MRLGEAKGAEQFLNQIKKKKTKEKHIETPNHSETSRVGVSSHCQTQTCWRLPEQTVSGDWNVGLKSLNLNSKVPSRGI